ncbi:MAG: glycerol-3-phosphate dehydrogenase/oxidase [Nitrospirota bacterium]|nr:glycerol-3-phosphate dehydrogenase/oxidase [Nitrospirota bacterium]
MIEGLVSKVWDVAVVGGGITGVAVAREAARAGLSVVLFEQRDFACGTSSRSSKMIHGGLRYLKQAKIGLVKEGARERERLLQEGAGLVEPLKYLYLIHKGDKMRPWMLSSGLRLYQALAKSKRPFGRLNEMDSWLSAPNVQLKGLKAAFFYFDGIVDDARLVYRVLREAERFGAITMNYTKVEGLLLNAKGEVAGLAVSDLRSSATHEIQARVVVNAAGALGDKLRAHLGKPAMLRPLRGTHLVFPQEKLPVALSVTFAHHRDGRPIYAFPWEGVSLVGTTDVDHKAPLDEEPVASEAEVSYLLEGIERRFRELGLGQKDMLGTYAGVRPVVGRGDRPPSEESREEALFDEQGLITITGGKLTTFRVMGQKTLAFILKRISGRGLQPKGRSVGLEQTPEGALSLVMESYPGLGLPSTLRLAGRYGPDLGAFMKGVSPADLKTVQGTPYSFGELVYAAKNERIVHLDDLLLRRTRLGHLLPKGGSMLGGKLKARLLAPLGWDEPRWNAEWKDYLALVDRAYAPMGG